jgi:Gas vesicle synthesis protein GvpO
MPSLPRLRGDRDQRQTSEKRRVDEDHEDEYEDAADPPERGGRPLSAPLAARAAVRHVQDLTGKPASGVTSVERVDDGWLVGVEVVEDRRIPSSTDILAVYMTQIEVDGSVESFCRARRYQRGRGDQKGESR